MVNLTTAGVKNARLSEPGIFCVRNRVISFTGISSVQADEQGQGVSLPFS